MQKQGAIILATGGDNSNGGEGDFYEGIMVTGATSDAISGSNLCEGVYRDADRIAPYPSGSTSIDTACALDTSSSNV